MTKKKAPRRCYQPGCDIVMTDRKRYCEKHRNKKCEVETCDRVAVSNKSKYCMAHDARLRYFGDVRADEPIRETPGRIPLNKTCTVEGCDLPRKAAGRCSKHYSQWRYARFHGRSLNQ